MRGFCSEPQPGRRSNPWDAGLQEATAVPSQLGDGWERGAGLDLSGERPVPP